MMTVIFVKLTTVDISSVIKSEITSLNKIKTAILVVLLKGEILNSFLNVVKVYLLVFAK